MNRPARHPNFAPTALAIAISLATAQLHAADLPTGGNIIGGSGSISQAGNSLNVQQNSDKLITNWDSFNIGAGNTVNFHQPGSNSVALNWVIGEDASAIYGNLNANGKVFLVNPNGVLFGQGAAVNVGALVASTLSLSDQDFNDGNYQFQGDDNNAAVINRGSITADGGAVALLGGQVSNHGVIQANQGTVTLAAGDKITLDFAGDGLLNVTVDEGTLNALVENHQLIRANGGQVVMTANATNALLQSVVNNTGIIEAQTLDNQSGTIVLKGGFNGGTVNVAGTLDASAPDSGDGGFIDTSGAHVKVADGTQVTTKANNGSTGEWLIDPTDFYITDSNDPQTSSGIGAATLSANLENNNVTLETVDTGTDDGDIYVNGAVSWNADTMLTLNAHNDIHINQAVNATGSTAGLFLSTGVDSDYSIASGASVTLSGLGATLNINGTDYTLIHDIAALGNIGITGLDGAYALAKSLDASGTTYDHALVGMDAANAFTGTFAGLGHTISDLTIENTAATTENWGLFGVNNGTIRDIGLEAGGVTIGAENTTLYAGQLAGRNNGVITNVYASGNVSAKSKAYVHVGGLLGYSGGTLINVYTNGEATATANFFAYVGGLAGSGNGTITNAYASGTATATASSNAYVGGLVGYHYDSTISEAYASGNVSSTSNSAYAYAYAGGLVGFSKSNITNAYATGNISATSNLSYAYAGGLVGYKSDGSISNAYATGTTTATAIDRAYSGGLIGVNNSSPISNTYATGAATATASGNAYAGGLMGTNGGSIFNSYATGAVITTSNASAYIGGLTGYNTGTITNSYWNTDTSGQTNAVGDGSSTGTTGLTSTQMMQADSFANWDIDAQGGTGKVWRIYEDHTAPLLRSFLTALEVTGDSITTYNGIDQAGNWSATGEYDADRIFGQVSGGGRNAGTYNIDMSGLYSDQQGYDLITSGSGTLTINKANATVTANSGTTTYNGTEQSVSGFTVEGLVNGEDASVLSGVTTNGGKGTNAGSYTLIASGSDANYELTFVDGTLTINKANATVTANSDTTTYNGTEQSGSGFTVEGLVNGEDQSVLTNVTVNGGGRNAGSYVLTASGSDGNYELTFVDGTLTIDRKTITADIRALDKLFDGSLTATLEGVLNGTISGDDVALQLSGLFASLTPGESRVLVDASLSGADAGNYQLVAPGEVIARLEGFVQTDDYQSAIVSKPLELLRLSAPTNGRYVLDIEDDVLRLLNSGQ